MRRDFGSEATTSSRTRVFEGCCSSSILKGEKQASDRPCRDAHPAVRVRMALELCEAEAIEVHHFGPSCHEVVDEFVLRVRAAVNFRQGA